MGKMKETLNEFFSFSDEEKEKLDAVSDELLEFLKEKKLTAKEALYVINKCEHVVYLSAVEKLI